MWTQDWLCRDEMRQNVNRLAEPQVPYSMRSNIAVIGLGRNGSEIVKRLASNPDILIDKLYIANRDENKIKPLAAKLEDYNCVRCRNWINDIVSVPLTDLEKVVAETQLTIFTAGTCGSDDRNTAIADNTAMMAELAPRFKGYKGSVIVLTNPCDIMTYVFQDFSQLPKDRVVGANHIDTVRLRYILTKRNDIWWKAPTFVLGPHDDKMFAYFATPHRVPPIIQEKIDGAVQEVISYAPRMVRRGTGTEHAVAAAVTEMVRAGQQGGIIGASTFGTLRDFLPRFTDPEYFPNFYDVDPDPGIYMGWPITFKEFKADPVPLAIFSHDPEITRIKDAYKHIVQLLKDRTTPQMRAKFERQAVANVA